MTQPQDPRQHPLQDDEIALARVLRALPAGEPSPRIDAAILAAATDAVAAAPGDRGRARTARRALPWLPTWAIGTAAAAVLAVGIGVQLRPPLAPTVSPQAEQAEAFRPLPESRPRLAVELPQADLSPPPPPAPPPAQPAQVRSERQAPRPPPPPAVSPAPAVVAPPPAPAPEAGLADAFPETAAAVPAEPEASDTLDSITVTGTRLPAAAPVESGDQARRRHQAAFATRAQQRAAAERELRELRAQTEARSGLGYSPQDAGDAAKAAQDAEITLPPVAADAGLAVDEWFDRIRLRRAVGDADGARASLSMLLRDHPEAELPDDLADLR